MTLEPPFDDEYATCETTHVGLNIIAEELDPDEVSQRLGLTPSSSHRKGHTTPSGVVRKKGHWGLSSQGAISSRDMRRHLTWLLDQLEPQHGTLASFRERGWHLDVSVFWVSAHGHGGPMLSPDLLRRLAVLGIELWFDLYF